MTEKEFELLKQEGICDHKFLKNEEVEFIETHISYIILLPQKVYKIKKSVSLAFLDFSQLEQRKKYCLKELCLNRRTAEEIYLEVVEIRKQGASFVIGSDEGEIVDYALCLKRMDNRREMDEMLLRGEVKGEHMEQLASTIANFHQGAQIIDKDWNLDLLRSTYSQILEWSDFAGEILGTEYKQIIEDSCCVSDHYLEQHIDLLRQRSKLGLVRDVHGDLHSHNIFLLDPPVLFDCIEFDDDLRQIDLLNEVAFFQMDLDYYHECKLGEKFYESYRREMQKFGIEELHDEKLLNYFKMYRASVRAKIDLIGLQNSLSAPKRHKLKESAIKYLELTARYGNLIT